MLSPVFWLSLVAVFWGIKWVADGLMSVAKVKVRHVPAAVSTVSVAGAPMPWREDTAAALEKAA